MTEKDSAQPRTVTMYGKQWDTVEAFAEAEGFNVSLALRKIVDEWDEFKRHQLTDTRIGYEVLRHD